MEAYWELEVRGDAAREVLEDEQFHVPPPSAPVAGDALASLRANSVRFSEGTARARRRAAVESELAAVSPGSLLGAAAAAAAAAGAVTAPRSVPVAVLAGALGCPNPSAVAAAAAVAAGPYLTGGGGGAESRAAEVIAKSAGSASPARLWARSTLLVQAYAGCAAAVENGLNGRSGIGQGGPAPVPATRRVAMVDGAGGLGVRAGQQVRVALDELPFGAGRHACPGREHALAIVSGVLVGLGRRR